MIGQNCGKVKVFFKSEKCSKVKIFLMISKFLKIELFLKIIKFFSKVQILKSTQKSFLTSNFHSLSHLLIHSFCFLCFGFMCLMWDGVMLFFVL